VVPEKEKKNQGVRLGTQGERGEKKPFKHVAESQNEKCVHWKGADRSGKEKDWKTSTMWQLREKRKRLLPSAELTLEKERKSAMMKLSRDGSGGARGKGETRGGSFVTAEKRKK